MLGRSIYLNATAKLEEELYDCDPEGFYQFIQSLKTRAAECGWDDEDSGVLMIPEEPGEKESAAINLLDEYRTICLETLTDYEFRI